MSEVQRRGAFLTAEWVNIVMLNYAVVPGLLRGYVPVGTELDSFDGRTYMSLVGFGFNRTRLAGMAIPFHGKFEEVNLRFYVRRGERRGVVFLRELVPKRAVAAVARWMYGENYSCVAMGQAIEVAADGGLKAEYWWGAGTGARLERCAMRIETSLPAFVPEEGSLSQFITEHYWGYATQRDGGSLEYEVQHPRWRVREAERAGFDGDAAQYYGEEFASELKRAPDSAFMAEGSAVTVYRGTKIG
jgi:uncharacterized protein YqjF (DUF2071 family)